MDVATSTEYDDLKLVPSAASTQATLEKEVLAEQGLVTTREEQCRKMVAVGHSKEAHIDESMAQLNTQWTRLTNAVAHRGIAVAEAVQFTEWKQQAEVVHAAIEQKLPQAQATQTAATAEEAGELLKDFDAFEVCVCARVRVCVCVCVFCRWVGR